MKKLSQIITTVFLLTIFVFSTLSQETPTAPPEKAPAESTKDEKKYDVPMIEKEGFSDGALTLNAEIEALKSQVDLKTSEDGTIYMKASFSGRKEIDKANFYCIWLATPNGKFKKIGEIQFSESEDTAEIKGRIPLENFGIFITAESESTEQPTSKNYTAFKP